jgi:hypothetical protein
MPRPLKYPRRLVVYVTDDMFAALDRIAPGKPSAPAREAVREWLERAGKAKKER